MLWHRVRARGRATPSAPADPARCASRAPFAYAQVYSKFTVTDVAAMLFQQNNAAAFAAASKHDHPIDTRWAYSSGTTNILSRYLRNTFSEAGGDAAYWRFPYQHLFSKVGMYSMILEVRGGTHEPRWSCVRGEVGW